MMKERQRRMMVGAVLVPSLVVAALAAACGDDDDVVTGPNADSGLGDQQVTGDTTTPPTDAPNDQGVVDAGTDALLTATTLAKFNATFGELAEGVAVLKENDASTPLVGLAPLGKVVRVLGDGGTPDFATFGSATQFFTLGLATDPANNVYIAVAQTGATPSVLPGIYRVGPGGGTPVVFAVPNALDPFSFVNGLDFVGTDLFATDSTGKIFKVTSAGITTKWLQDNALAGDEQDCKLGNGFPIGANGIAHDANNNIFVVNTDKGTLLKIPGGGGDAGAIEVIKKDPELCGADGLAIDKDGTFLVAVNAKDTILRVTATGAITTIAKGTPLDSPASVVIDTNGTTRRLLVTNAAFRSVATDGGKPAPSLVSFPLAN